MTTTYPGTIDSFTNPAGTNTLSSPDHALQHTNTNTAVIALENALGTTGGTSVLKNFVAGDFAARKVGESFSSATYTSGTITTSLFSSGTASSPVINGAGGTVGGQQGFDATNKSLTIGDGATNQSVDIGVWRTYVPTVASSGGTITSASATGRYCKVGKLVFVSAIATITTNGSGTTSVTVTLPVTARASGEHIFSGRANAVTGKMLQGIVAPSSVSIFDYTNSYPGANGEQLIVNGFYEAA